MSDAKKQPPPPPSRDRRVTLSNQNLKQEIPESKSEVEQPVSPAPVEEEQVWVEPVDLQNGVAVEKEDLLPNKYKYYRIWVEGTEEDIVDITISKIVHTAATSIFVNFPGNENWPTKDFHDWNPTQVTLQGPVGEYKVAVYAVPSYIDKDDKWLIDPNNNRASFDLSAEWYLLDEEAKATLKKMEQQFKREKTSSVWASAYSSELVDKYQKQTEEIEQENNARAQQVGGPSEINLDGTPITKSYTLGAIIGRGDFSVVKKGKRNSDGKEVAIKIIDKLAAKEAGFDENILKRQSEICKGIDSPNIVKFIESFDTDKATCIVSESLEGGEIVHKLAEKVDQPYSEESARKIVVQILKAVEYLHSKNIVHKNIVPRNILFKTKDLNEIALVGFTLSQIVKSEDELDVFGGDASFQAPELLQRQGFGKGVDLWAVGVVTYILLSGYRPFQDTNTMRLYSKIRQGQYELPDAEWKAVSSEAKDFIQKLLNIEPNARITVQDALKHVWITGKVDNKLPNVRKNLTKYED